tara:strand:+ start:3387 stop:3731 length:345 start_codon:yes stop_codon:yes gene_type:complete
VGFSYFVQGLFGFVHVVLLRWWWVLLIGCWGSGAVLAVGAEGWGVFGCEGVAFGAVFDCFLALGAAEVSVAFVVDGVGGAGDFLADVAGGHVVFPYFVGAVCAGGSVVLGDGCF